MGCSVFGTFSLDQPINFYNCEMFGGGDGCPIPNDLGRLRELGFFYSEVRQDWHEGDEPWFLIAPYTIDELFSQRSDWALVPMCNGAFNILEDSFVFADNEIYEEDLRTQSRELELSEMVFTERFLDFIEADQRLLVKVRSAGLLTVRANELFRQAWLEGRLKRPVVVWAFGECGAGGNVVQITFKEPTSRFQIIPDFDYLICDRVGLDPWNVDQCPHVRDQLNDLQILSGRYRARITRESGEIFFRAIDINDVDDQALEI